MAYPTENNDQNFNSATRVSCQTMPSDKLIIESLLNQINKAEDKLTRWHQFNHLFRYAETVKICPAGPARILDLGASDVYGPVIAQLGGSSIKGVETLAFNFETERFPFPDAQFDGALFCEVIEHFIDDPMFCLGELNRIIKEGGFLVLTTPNAASWEAIYRALHQRHPSRWPTYSNGGIGTHCIHAREYVVDEVVALVDAAGFTVEKIYTRNYQPTVKYEPIGNFTNTNRGETIFCLARKVSAPVMRYVPSIYDMEEMLEETSEQPERSEERDQRMQHRGADQSFISDTSLDQQPIKHTLNTRLRNVSSSVLQHLSAKRYRIMRMLTALRDPKPEINHETVEVANLPSETMLISAQDEKLLKLLSSQLDMVENDALRQNQTAHIYRHLEIINLCPSGPANVLDLGSSSVYGPVLAKVRSYSMEAVKGLAFNFEADRYPFEDASFDGTLLCEVIQQYTDDPMFSLIEINRVVKGGGFLVLTTPNVASWGAIYRALNQRHPSQWPLYARGHIGAHSLYAREYLVSEVAALVEGAGFAVQKLYTRTCKPDITYEPINNYDTRNRGETIFCLARKISAPKKRFVGGIAGEDTPYLA